MQDELNQLERNKVWALTTRPNDYPVDHCHICIGLVGYLGFILGDLNEYSGDLHPYFSNYARF